MHVNGRFCLDCDDVISSLGIVVYITIVVLSLVECAMFQLTNEREYGMQNNN